MKKEYFIYLLLLTLLSINIKSIAQNDSSYLFEKFSKKELKEDIEFAMNKIEEIHPEPYHYVSKELILKEKNRILESFDDSVSRLDFLRKFAPLLNIYNNGHIQLHGFIYDKFLNYSLTHGGRLFPFLVNSTLRL